MLRLRSSLLVAAVGRCRRRSAAAPANLRQPRRCFAPSSSSHGSNNSHDDDDAKKRAQAMTDYYSQYLQEYYAPASDADEEVSSAAANQPAPSIPLERGEMGVFDPDELVTVLREERAENIVCISIPNHVPYSDYMVICSCFNSRHMEALVETIQKLYKQKRGPEDPPVTLAGANDKQWRAMDMSNIVLHIMTEQARDKYDLEQLWSVGPDFDQLTVQQQQQQQQQAAVEYDNDDWLTALPPPRSTPSKVSSKGRSGTDRRAHHHTV